MNKANGRQLFPAAKQQVDDVASEIQPNIIIIVVQILGDVHFTTSGEPTQIVECYSETDKRLFEVVLLSDNTLNVDGQRKLKLFKRLIAKVSGGWQAQFFNADDVAFKLMLDRDRKKLLINVDVLRMSYRSLIKLIGRVPEMIYTLLKSVESTMKRANTPRGAMSLSSTPNASMALTVVAEKGLRLPSGFALTAENRLVRVTITDVDICIQSASWKWMHGSVVALAFHSYKIEIEVDGDSYLIRIPPDVLSALSPGLDLSFDVYSN